MKVPKNMGQNMAQALFQALLWPGLLGGWVWLLLYMVQQGYEPVTAFAIVVYGGNVVLFALEYALPYSLKWRKIDNQFGNDIAHTLAGNWVRSVVLSGVGLWFTLYVYTPQLGAANFWTHLNWWPQFFAALIVCDFGKYWYHRTIHERWGGWAFHALHHSARRLWVGNAGRTHFIDAAGFTFFGFVLLFACRFSGEVIFWVAVTNVMVGALSHCNIKMRLGVLNYIFNTPVLHRWHHSDVLSEGNRNYGQVLAFWDHIFGTYYNPGHPPNEVIGTRLEIPDNLIKQFYYPLVLLTQDAKKPWVYIGEKPTQKQKEET